MRSRLSSEQAGAIANRNTSPSSPHSPELAAELLCAFRAFHRGHAEYRGQLIVKVVDAVGDIAEQQMRIEVPPPEGDAGEKADAVARRGQQGEYGGQPAVDFQIDQGIVAEEFPERPERIGHQRKDSAVVANDHDFVEDAQKRSERRGGRGGDEGQLPQAGQTPQREQRGIGDYQAAAAQQLQDGDFTAVRKIVIAVQQLSQKNGGNSQDGVKEAADIIIQKELGAKIHSNQIIRDRPDNSGFAAMASRLLWRDFYL